MIDILRYFSFPYVQRAVIVGVIIAFCSALLGVVLVLKRYSFIGDGLSHVAFGGFSVAAVIGVTNNMLIIMPITIAVAIIILFNNDNKKINTDALIAMLSVGSLAIGYLIFSMFSTTSNTYGDVCSTLFGAVSILNLKNYEVFLCIGLSIIVIIFYIISYNYIFAVTFDENFCVATGTNVKLYNILFSTIVALVIVLAMKLVGSLLISALIIFPALSAMRVCKKFKSVVIVSAIISVVCAFLGIFMSIAFSTPVGPSITAVNMLCYLVCLIIGGFKK